MSLSHSPKIVTDGLRMCFDVGNIKSYPGSGTDWLDLISNVTATAAGSPTFNTGYVNFNGTSRFSLDTVSYGGGTTIAEMSVFAWIRTTFDDGTAAGSTTISSANWAILDFDRSEVFTFAIDGGGEVHIAGRPSSTGGYTTYLDIKGTATVNDGNWHYAGYTYSVANQEIVTYVDGEVDVTFTPSVGSFGNLGSGSTRYGVIGDGSEAGTPGGGANDVYYEGDISAIHFYDNKALTASEVKNNYKALKSRFGL